MKTNLLNPTSHSTLGFIALSRQDFSTHLTVLLTTAIPSVVQPPSPVLTHPITTCLLSTSTLQLYQSQIVRLSPLHARPSNTYSQTDFLIFNSHHLSSSLPWKLQPSALIYKSCLFCSWFLPLYNFFLWLFGVPLPVSPPLVPEIYQSEQEPSFTA